MHNKVSFKIFPWGQDAHLNPNNLLNVPESATTQREPSSSRKLVIDPENVSSFYAINPTILKMPFLSLDSQSVAQERSLKNWHLDKNWIQLCGEVTSPFPLNRTVIKHELNKTNQFRSTGDGRIKEMSQGDDMFSLFQLDHNSKKLREIVQSGSLSSNRHSDKHLPVPYNPNDKLVKAYMELNGRKQQIRHNLRGAIPVENQRRKSCSCKWCGGISEKEKKLEKLMWLDLNGGFGPVRRRSTSPNASTLGGKRKKKTPNYANPLRRNRVKGATMLTRQGSKRIMGRMSTVSGVDSDSGDLDDKATDAARRSTQLAKKKSSFMVPLEKGVSKTLSKSPNRLTLTSEGITVHAQQTSELNEICNTPLRLKLPTESLFGKNVNKSVGSKEGLSIHEFDGAGTTSRSRTPLKEDGQELLGQDRNRGQSPVAKDAPDNMILNFGDLEMKKPLRLKIPIHIKWPSSKEGTKAKTAKPKTVRTKETDRPKKEVLPPVKEKKGQEGESAVLKDGLKKLISDRLATQPEKIVSIYENSSDYLFFKPNKPVMQHTKSNTQSQTMAEPSSMAVQAKKDDRKKEASPYFFPNRSSVGPSNLLMSNKAFRIQSRSNRSMNRTDIVSEEERSTEVRLNVKSIDEKRTDTTAVPSKSSSMMKTAQNTPKHYSSISARFMLDVIPPSPKSNEDFIMGFYRKKNRRKI